MLNNSQLRRQARFALEGRWGTFVLVTLLSSLIPLLLMAPGYGLQIGMPQLGESVSSGWQLLVALVLLPMTWSINVMYLRSRRGEQMEISNMFDGFRRTNSIMITGILYFIYLVVYLIPVIVAITGTIAFVEHAETNLGTAAMIAGGVVGGALTLAAFVLYVVKMLALDMWYYILLDTPLTGRQALRESMRMMQGHKMRLFMLYLSFLPYLLLVILTLGLASLFVSPYMEASKAEFYEDLLAQSAETEQTSETTTEETATEGTTTSEATTTSEETTTTEATTTAEQSIYSDKKYKLTLVDAGPNKISIVKAVCDTLELSIYQAKNLTDNTPSLLVTDLTAARATEIKQEFEHLGATVEMQPY